MGKPERKRPIGRLVICWGGGDDDVTYTQLLGSDREISSLQKPFLSSDSGNKGHG
jgi:hypothetical protein